MTKNKSQKESILNDLKDGLSVTPMDALKEYGCFRLAAVVCQLRKDGWDIETNNVTKNNGKGTYASYKLSPFARLRT